MIFSEDNYKFMFAALQEAEKAFDADEVPIGAVIVYKNKITPDYTYFKNLIDNEPNYSTLLKYRILLKDFIKTNEKKCVKAVGKYKFKYHSKKYELELPDENGIIDGLYSFTDTANTVNTIDTINNTISVLNKLYEAVYDLSEEMYKLVDKLCSTSDLC